MGALRRFGGVDHCNELSRRADPAVPDDSAREASKATNLFHVIPAVTQIMASVTLGEAPGALAVAGFVVSGVGVYLMNHARTS